MPDVKTYTPSELADEVQTLAENYRGAVAEITEDNSIFSDISAAIQRRTGQVLPYDKTEMANAIDNLVVISADPNSSTPIEFGQDVDGFYFSDTAGEGSLVYLGRDQDGPYSTGGSSNE